MDRIYQIIIAGKMDNTLDHTFESANRIYDSNGICPTLPTAQGGGITPKILEKEDITVDKVNEVGFMNSGTGKHQSNTVYDEKGCSPALTTLQGGTQQIKICEGTKDIKPKKYKIRKLTALECFRLMNFDDDDFYAAESVNSNTQLYKQSGNSIVVGCLTAIFSQLNIQEKKTWNDSSLEERRLMVKSQIENPRKEIKNEP